jgi:hypothetical protein
MTSKTTLTGPSLTFISNVFIKLPIGLLSFGKCSPNALYPVPVPGTPIREPGKSQDIYHDSLLQTYMPICMDIVDGGFTPRHCKI